MELLCPWDAYARLQKSLGNENRLGDHSWGIEAGMDFILKVSPIVPPSSVEIDLAIATARRRERYRGSRQGEMPECIATTHPERCLQARHDLAAIQRNVSNDNWKLLNATAEGADYGNLSKLLGKSPETLRAKVSRLRKEVRAFVERSDDECRQASNKRRQRQKA